MPGAAPDTPTRYFNNVDAAAYIGLSPRTLEKYRVTGGGPIFRKLGRRVLYVADDLLSLRVTPGRERSQLADLQRSAPRPCDMGNSAFPQFGLG
jgi:hypothetical protein